MVTLAVQALACVDSDIGTAARLNESCDKADVQSRVWGNCRRPLKFARAGKAFQQGSLRTYHKFDMHHATLGLCMPGRCGRDAPGTTAHMSDDPDEECRRICLID